MIGLSSSTLYYQPKYSRAQREENDSLIRAEIEKIRVEFPRSGYRTLQHYLAREGFSIGETKLRRIIKKYSLQAEIKRAFKITTDSNHGYRVYPNRLPGLVVTDINQVWTSDLSYIRIANGFVYLAVILDLYSRKIIGWAISKSIDGDLALSALQMAIQKRQPKPGCIHHSDRGVQYLCKKYVTFLKAHGLEISNSAKGNPYHNAWTESLIKTLKQEEVYLANYETYLDVIDNLPGFIEEVYNEKRVHSAIGYMTPNELENNRNSRQFILQL